MLPTVRFTTRQHCPQGRVIAASNKEDFSMGLPNFKQRAIPLEPIWRCSGCGNVAEGNVKPCDCITGVGSGKTEHTSFEWDEWYSRLPDDLTRRLSLYDFKRLGDLFKDAFGIS